MKLDKLTIELEPWIYSDYETHKFQLKIRLKIGMKEVISHQILDEDDFQSTFDFTFDRAKSILESELKKLVVEKEKT